MKTVKQPSNTDLRIAKLSFGGFIARRYFLGVLAISLLKMTQLQAFATDAPDAAPSVKPTPSDREFAIDAQLDGVLKFDREIASREDMTSEEMNKGSTAALLKHFLSSKMAVWLSLYDDPNMGVRRSLRGSRTLAEGFRRPDIIQAFIDWNQNLIPVLNQMAPGNAMGKGISSRIMGGDALLQYPEMVKKWKGFEKPLLRVMCERPIHRGGETLWSLLQLHGRPHQNARCLRRSSR